MRRRVLLGAGCALLASPSLVRASSIGPNEVDLLLVLAADVSQSMQPRDLHLQREGYVAAMRDPVIVEAMCSGPCGAIGLVYLEWSGMEDQRVVVPWARIGDAADAERFAASLGRPPRRAGSWTSITGAIAASRRVLAASPYEAARQVIDISGDGQNNQGGHVDAERDAAVMEGVTINGLPILRELRAYDMPLEDGEEAPLVQHYRRLVIGGGGAFIMPARGFTDFAGALRRKMVLEIAGYAGRTGARPA
jgi:hypothetical protein